MNLKLLFVTGCLALSTVNATEQISASEAFAELKELVGNWEGKTEKGRVIKVSYHLTAADTVLVETWTLGPDRESLTLYHMDHENLLATHYCPAGNQPRLRLRMPTTASLLTFEFIGATNLLKSGISHQHQFEIEPLQKNSFARSETYLEEGESDTERIVYTRTKPETPKSETPPKPEEVPPQG